MSLRKITGLAQYTVRPVSEEERVAARVEDVRDRILGLPVLEYSEDNGQTWQVAARGAAAYGTVQIDNIQKTGTVLFRMRYALGVGETVQTEVIYPDINGQGPGMNVIAGQDIRLKIDEV